MTKKFSLAFLIFALPASMLFTSCEPEDTETCEEVPEVCEEPLTACANSTEEYYIIEGDTIYCNGVDDCGTALGQVVDNCTAVLASNKDEDIIIRLEFIMNELRLLNN